jgi:hypothetical protein
MAKKVTNTGAGAFKFIKPDYIVATLFDGTETDESAPKGDSYILEDVIEDSTSISQDDNDSTDIECETSDSPIISIVKLGKWQLSAEIGDTQKELLAALCDFTDDAAGKKTLAPSTYKAKYAKIDIVQVQSNGTTMEAYVLPKVQLNSKLTIESLNSNLARIALAGTAKDISLTVGAKTVRTPFYVDHNYSLPTATE